jgi:polysaccharide deacetylase family protein (PEP-CTERM system associated)
MLNALSFDIEEYFQVEALRGLVRPDDWDRLESRVVPVTLRLLDMLDRHRVRATFFVVGWVAERQPELVREIARRGHELACHGYAHLPVYAMEPESFREDLRHARRAIEDAAGEPIIGYRAPTCSIVRETLWALPVLAAEGFRYDSSIFPIHHDRYGIPDAARFPHRVPGADLVEFPLTTVRLAGQNLPCCGGGYFRLLPYPLVRAGLRHVNASDGMPGIVYLHPWEFDPDQPRFALRGLAAFRHYVNLRHTADKLERLLDDFAFGPVDRVLESMGELRSRGAPAPPDASARPEVAAR